MTQNGSFFSHIPPASNNKGTCLFYLQKKKKKQYKQTSKEYPADTWFSSDQTVYQTGIHQTRLGHCVASNPLPPAPG